MITEDEPIYYVNDEEPNEVPEDVIEVTEPEIVSSCCEAPISANGNLMVCTQCNEICDLK